MPKPVILVPVDFEEAAMKAIELAKEFAQAFGGEVTLLHVQQIPLYVYPGLGPSPVPFFHPELIEAARGALADLATTTGVSRTFLREGDPAAEILDTAKETGAKMIVMGTHGRGGLAHLFLGSVAEKVVRQSPVPVTTIRAPEKA